MCVLSVPEGCRRTQLDIFVEGLRRDCYAAVEGGGQPLLPALEEDHATLRRRQGGLFIYKYHLGKDDSEDMAKNTKQKAPLKVQSVIFGLVYGFYIGKK